MGLGDTLWNGAKSAYNYFVPQVGQPGITPQEQQLLDRNNALVAREQGVFDQQGQLSNLLFMQATGVGPSFAGAQLGAGLEMANRNALSASAGAGGNNGVLARYAAMNNAAQLAAQTNQQQGMARTQEMLDGRQLLGQNLHQMAGQSSNLYGTNLQGFTGLRGVDVQQQANANAQKNKVLGAGLSFASAKGASSLAGPASALSK